MKRWQNVGGRRRGARCLLYVVGGRLGSSENANDRGEFDVSVLDGGRSLEVSGGRNQNVDGRTMNGGNPASSPPPPESSQSVLIYSPCTVLAALCQRSTPKRKEEERRGLYMYGGRADEGRHQRWKYGRRTF